MMIKREIQKGVTKFKWHVLTKSSFTFFAYFNTSNYIISKRLHSILKEFTEQYST